MFFSYKISIILRTFIIIIFPLFFFKEGNNGFRLNTLYLRIRTNYPNLGTLKYSLVSEINVEKA